MRTGFSAGGQVVCLASWVSAAQEFTEIDRRSLLGWGGDAKRFSLCTSEVGPFALLYQHSAVWASWGLVRVAGRIKAWNCVSLRDAGVFLRMAEALTALSAGDAPISRCGDGKVVELRRGRVECGGTRTGLVGGGARSDRRDLV